MNDTPFDHLGGHPAIRGLVDAFYGKIFAVPALARLLQRTDLEELKQRQARIIAALLGAPEPAPDAPLRSAHADFSVSVHDLEQILLLLRETLEEAGVEAAPVGAVVAEMRRRGQAIVQHDRGH
jgi:truncated hemoglobin YjbI